jgi:hypothetical protein
MKKQLNMTKNNEYQVEHFVPKRLLLQMKFPKTLIRPTLSPCGRMLQSASQKEVKAWYLGTTVDVK